jgi:hypothetical protein
MKKINQILLLSLLMIFSMGHFAISQENGKKPHFTSLSDKANYYRSLFKVKCSDEKITDNFGNGFDSAYGTRNMRTVLYGVAYRGGANNFYHKENKRENHNPLPEDGLQHLANLGFSHADYLYATNFTESAKLFISSNKSDTLTYFQNSGNSRKDLRKIFLKIMEIIENPSKGPIYLHCWNGWHQSGYLSATILMQFCKLTNDEAYDYWLRNTDGVNKGYEGVKGQVRNFIPFEDISIADSVRKIICPCIGK